MIHGGAVVEQVRNPHDYLEDFRLEIPLYTDSIQIYEIVRSNSSKGLRTIITALAESGYLRANEVGMFDKFQASLSTR